MNNEIFNYDEFINRFLGEKEIAKDILINFIKKVPYQIYIIENYIENRCFDKIFFESHNIKGNAYNISAKHIAKSALNIENASRNNDIEEIIKNFNDLKVNYNEFIEEINKYSLMK